MQQMIVSGTVIDHRYQIQNKIRDNTSNCCYLAEDTTQSNRLVVLSFPRIELLILPGFANAFQDACHHLAQSRINHTVKILDSGLHESQPYAVLQHMTHDSLQTQLQQARSSGHAYTLEEVLDWATPLAVSLDELHEADYIHSNVRPESVYLGSQQLLLGDFITEFTLQRMGKFKSAISTLNVDHYLAPEYLKSNYTPAYDQYLLATLIYEALTGKTPFSAAKGGDEYRMQVATLMAEPLAKHRSELVEVSDILARALDRNPANRYASCRELVSRLSDVPVSTAKVVSLKPAHAIQEVQQAEEPTVPEAPIVTSIRNEAANERRKKGMMWLGLVLLGSAAAAYTVISQNGAEITSNPAKVQRNETAQTIVPVSVTSETVAASDPAVNERVVQAQNASTLSAIKDNVPQVPKQTAEVVESDTATTDVKVSELKNLIAQAAVLAQQEAVAELKNETEAEPAREPVVSAVSQQEADQSGQAKAADVPTKPQLVINQDLSALSDAISQAVSAGQKEFLESRQAADTDTVPVAAASVPIDVTAITSQVSAAVQGEVDARSAEQEAQARKAREEEERRLNQELLAVQALVQQREAIARRAAEKAAERKQAEEQAERDAEKQENAGQARSPQRARNQQPVEEATSNDTAETDTSTADTENTAADTSSGGEATATPDSAQTGQHATTPPQAEVQKALSERERIRAFKQKELARIKSVTDNCVIGGKIHREAAAGNLAFVKSCMAVGVDPNIAQSNRWTLLHIAARSGHLNMSKLLIAKGATVNAKSAEGMTALDMAISQRKTRVANYLRTRGGTTTR